MSVDPPRWAGLTLALGIGIQNLPEGTAVALPIRGTGASRLKSFFFGQLSAVVEPVAAVIGAALVTLARPALPYALAFAAGAIATAARPAVKADSANFL